MLAFKKSITQRSVMMGARAMSQSIQKVGVVGLGLMGHGIAQVHAIAHNPSQILPSLASHSPLFYSPYN